MPQIVQDNFSVLVTEPSGIAIPETAIPAETTVPSGTSSKPAKRATLKPNSKWKKVKKSSILEIAIQRNYNVAQKASYQQFRRILTIANINLTQETFNAVFSSIMIITGISLITLFSRDK